MVLCTLDSSQLRQRREHCSVRAPFSSHTNLVLTWAVHILWTTAGCAVEADGIDDIAAQVPVWCCAIAEDGKRIVREMNTWARCVAAALERGYVWSLYRSSCVREVQVLNPGRLVSFDRKFAEEPAYWKREVFSPPGSPLYDVFWFVDHAMETLFKLKLSQVRLVA